MSKLFRQNKSPGCWVPCSARSLWWFSFFLKDGDAWIQVIKILLNSREYCLWDRNLQADNTLCWSGGSEPKYYMCKGWDSTLSFIYASSIYWEPVRYLCQVLRNKTARKTDMVLDLTKITAEMRREALIKLPCTSLHNYTPWSFLEGKKLGVGRGKTVGAGSLSRTGLSAEVWSVRVGRGESSGQGIGLYRVPTESPVVGRCPCGVPEGAQKVSQRAAPGSGRWWGRTGRESPRVLQTLLGFGLCSPLDLRCDTIRQCLERVTLVPCCERVGKGTCGRWKLGDEGITGTLGARWWCLSPQPPVVPQPGRHPATWYL